MLDVEIRIKGQIDTDWSELLGSLIIIPTGGGETHLVGRVRDQAMLRGLLNELADLGLELISVTTLTRSEEN
jgi:hypothetical protein